MNVVVATDDNFVQHCSVMLCSLLDNNEKGIRIYLLTEGISDVNNLYIEKLVVSKGGFYHYIKVDSELLRNCPMPDNSKLSHISIATYYRLLIPDLLPRSVSKVIYLDCDIVIRKPILKLWESDIDGYAIGAVSQMTSRTLQDAHRLNYPIKYGYFNAGVLLINVDYWRSNFISMKLMKFLNDNSKDIIFHDQDALNGVLFNKTLILPCKWNMISIFFRQKIFEYSDVENGKIINDYKKYKNELKTEAYNPTLVHFVAKPKPWDAKCTHPFRNEYYKYLMKTKWKNYKEPSLVISILYRTTRRIMLMFGFLNNPYIK